MVLPGEIPPSVLPLLRRVAMAAATESKMLGFSPTQGQLPGEAVLPAAVRATSEWREELAVAVSFSLPLSPKLAAAARRHAVGQRILPLLPGGHLGAMQDCPTAVAARGLARLHLLRPRPAARVRPES